jgi:hypothetical protein
LLTAIILQIVHVDKPLSIMGVVGIATVMGGIGFLCWDAAVKAEMDTAVKTEMDTAVKTEMDTAVKTAPPPTPIKGH